MLKRWGIGAVALALLAGTAAAAAASGRASEPGSVSLTVSPGGAQCTYSNVTTPKLKCVHLTGARITSGTKITLVAKANAAMPAGLSLYVQKEGPFVDNRAAHKAGRQDSYPAPHLCGPTRAASCTAATTRKVSVTNFDVFLAVVQKADGTSFEADLAIRWCDSSTRGCVS